jgi:hypothetical protein
VIHLAVIAGLAELKAVKVADSEEMPDLSPLSLAQAENIVGNSPENDKTDEEIIEGTDESTDTLTAVTKV